MFGNINRSQDLRTRSTSSMSTLNADHSPLRPTNSSMPRRFRASANQHFSFGQDADLSFSRAFAKAPKDKAGDTFADARKITFKSKQIMLKDFVGMADNDYYQLDFSKKAPTSVLNLSFSSKEGASSFGLGLYDSNGNFLQSVGTKLTRTVVSGTYYLKVSPALLGGGNYSLKLSADLIPDKVGNVAQDARSISVKSNPTSFDEFVGRGDRTDYYKFEVTETSSFNLNISGLKSNLLDGGTNLYLRDSNLGLIKYLSSIGGGVSLSNQLLAPGTYYIQMEPFSSTQDSNYRMTVSMKAF